MTERPGDAPTRATDPDFVRAVEVLGAAPHVALACHVNPDGDALGSMLGMFHALRVAGRDVVASFPPPFEVARHYRELPGLDLLTAPEDFPEEPAVMVTFDCGSLDRLGALAANAKAATELIVVDHHISNDRYGSINVIQPDAAASGTVALELIDAVGLSLDRDAAVCLYAALVCDTGRFQYDTTTPEVFEIARRLSEFDLPIADLSRSLFEEHSFAYLQMLGEALQSAHLVREQRFVYTAITQDLLTRHGVRIDEVEGLIDVLRRATEAEVSCVLKEEADGTIRVSLRSLGGIDVRRVAEAHGGGGHRFAAGFSSSLDLDTVIARIRAAI